MLLNAEFWQTIGELIRNNMIVVYVAIATIIGSIISFIIFYKRDN